MRQEETNRIEGAERGRTISAADKMSLASHRPLSHPLCQPCTALLTQAATPRNRCSRGKSSEKTIRAIGCAFLSSFLFLSLSISFSLFLFLYFSVFRNGEEEFSNGLLQLVPRLFRPFSSRPSYPPPCLQYLASSSSLFSRIRPRFSQAAARVSCQLVEILQGFLVFRFGLAVSAFL